MTVEILNYAHFFTLALALLFRRIPIWMACLFPFLLLTEYAISHKKHFLLSLPSGARHGTSLLRFCFALVSLSAQVGFCYLLIPVREWFLVGAVTMGALAFGAVILLPKRRLLFFFGGLWALTSALYLSQGLGVIGILSLVIPVSLFWAARQDRRLAEHVYKPYLLPSSLFVCIVILYSANLKALDPIIIKQQPGVSSIFTADISPLFKGGRDNLFQRITFPRVTNQIVEMCSSEDYLVGFIMHRDWLGRISAAGDHARILPIERFNYQSSNMISLCDSNQHVVGGDFYLVLLQESPEGVTVRQAVPLVNKKSPVGDDNLLELVQNPVDGAMFAVLLNGQVRPFSVDDQGLHVKEYPGAVFLPPEESYRLFAAHGNQMFLMSKGSISTIRIQKAVEGRYVAETLAKGIWGPKYYSKTVYVPQHDRLYFSDPYGGYLHVFTGSSLSPLKKIRLGRGIRYLAYNPDFDILFAANYHNGSLFYLQPDTGQILQTLNFGGNLRGIRFSRDRKKVLLVCAAGLYTLDIAQSLPPIAASLK